MSRYLFDTIEGRTTAPGLVLNVAGTIAALAAGDSLTIKPAADIRLLPAIVFSNVSGQLQIKSTQMHDGNNAIQVGHTAAQPYGLWPAVNPPQQLKNQDTLQLQISGSAVGGQIEECLLPVMYTDPVSGNSANLANANDVRVRGTGQIAVVTTTHVAGVLGGYSAPIVLNAATVYNLYGNKNYVLLGAQTNTMGCGMTLKGPGTGQTRIAIPAHSTNKDYTCNYLYWLSLSTGFPTMPIISTADGGVTILEVVSNQAGGTYVVNWFFMLLN